jgi:PIN domain nuclease of toxin-antitoxin system
MRFLLDTHIWLWSSREPDKLSSQVYQALSDPGNGRFLSPISIWEVLLLIEKKKLEMHEDFRKWHARTVEDLALEEAAVTSKVVHEMRSILPHQRDPADRFLAATAITYDLVLVTADQKLMAVPGLKVLAVRVSPTAGRISGSFGRRK